MGLNFRRQWKPVLAILGVVCLLTATGCKPAKIDLKDLPKTFKAKIKVNDGLQESVIVRKGQNVRLEVLDQGRSIIQILNVDRKKAYTLMPNQKLYYEGPYDEKRLSQSDPVEEFLALPGVRVEEVGTETVDGHPCQKLKLTIQSEGKEATSLIWCATDLRNFVIKIEGDSGGRKHTIVFSDVSFEVPDSMFVPPDDYRQGVIPQKPAKEPNPSSGTPSKTQ